LEKDPLKRLGGGPNDADEIKAHDFFKDVNWNDFINLKVTPPFFPMVVSFIINIQTSPTDISNFDVEFTRELPILTPCNSYLSDLEQQEFQGFTYFSKF
jgi:hypothetical protein